MRNLKTNVLAIALVLISGAALATGNLNVNITTGESEKAVVDVSNAVKSHFEIEVKNEDGNIIYFKETDSPSTSYNRIYDFSRLDDGFYTFTVKLDEEMETSTLHIVNGKVDVINKRKDAEPFFAFNNNLLAISYLNFEKEDLKLYVYDNATNRLIFEKELSPDFAVNYALNFSNLKRGSYDAVLANGKSAYEYNIAID